MDPTRDRDFRRRVTWAIVAVVVVVAACIAGITWYNKAAAIGSAEVGDCVTSTKGYDVYRNGDVWITDCDDKDAAYKVVGVVNGQPQE